MGKYQPRKIEEKWQKIWEEARLYEPEMRKARRPFYNLMMFPYPSAEGLHVGNMYAFTGSDIYGRYKMMQGFDVFEPIGLDGFGIHSENYALKTGQHPMALSKVTAKRFYEQLHATGNAFAWSHKLETYDPDYYKGTQWLFLRLYKAGLAYRQEAPVNFCPSCKTVLADEQVIQGRCERCQTGVVTKKLQQWFFKITAYAEKLLNNLEKIDWSERVKIAQRNWIGRSAGAELKFKIQNAKIKMKEQNSKFVKVFTTRIDTIFGATFLVLSPEHRLARAISQRNKRVRQYLEQAKKKAEQERLEREKTGVDTGLKAVNPATGEMIPVWVADFVLAQYGGGAVMGVPAHDQRDFEFATKYQLPIRMVVCPNYPEPICPVLEQAYEDEGHLIGSGKFDGLRSEEARGEITAWLKKKGLAQKAVSYHLRDWLISRQRYWGPPIPVIYCRRCWENQKPKTENQKLKEGTDYTMIAGKEYAIIPVPEKDLPVKLPHLEDFKPLGRDESPLAQDPKFYQTKCPACGGPARRETDVSDTFLDSAWYYLRYPSVGAQNLKLKTQNHKAKVKPRELPWSKDITQKWLPVDMYIGGAEHSVLHLMYSRFITQALHDLGWLDFEEPFTKFRAHGLLIAEGAKMSKSRGNIVVPDEYIKKFGADTLRMYLMFLGPFGQGGDFRDEGIMGIWRFLNRVWALAQKLKTQNIRHKSVARLPVISPPLTKAPAQNSKLNKKLHQTIKKVTEDIEGLKFNTAIAALMSYLNELEEAQDYGLDHLKGLLLLLAPFAPHISEELWQSEVRRPTNGFRSIFQEKWPEYNPKLIEEKTFTLIVQINGKTRDQVEAPRGLSEKEAKALALKSPKTKKGLEEKEIKKAIYIKDRLLNLVVAPR